MNVAANTRATFIPDIQGSVIGSLDSSSGTITRFGDFRSVLHLVQSR